MAKPTQEIGAWHLCGGTKRRASARSPLGVGNTLFWGHIWALGAFPAGEGRGALTSNLPQQNHIPKINFARPGSGASLLDLELCALRLRWPQVSGGQRTPFGPKRRVQEEKSTTADGR